MRTLTAVAVVGLPMVFACATADKAGFQQNNGSNHVDGGTITHPDSSTPQIDAFIPPDAPPGVMSKTLSETTLDTLTSANSIACPTASTLDVGTTENHYLRVFDLATFGITTDFNVSSISFQVEDCESIAGNGSLVNVAVGSYNGTPGTTLARSNMTQLATATGVQVPEVDEVNNVSPGATINVPIVATIPAGGKVYVEVISPDGTNDHQFYIGSNTGGQSAPGYVQSGGMTAAVCSPPGKTPTDINTLSGVTNVDILLTVTGTY